MDWPRRRSVAKPAPASFALAPDTPAQRRQHKDIGRLRKQLTGVAKKDLDYLTRGRPWDAAEAARRAHAMASLSRTLERLEMAIGGRGIAISK